MKIHWFIFCFISTLWVGCSIKDLSNPVRPEPTESGMYIHPASKLPFDGLYDVMENGVRLRMEIKAGWPHGRWQRWHPSGQLHEEYNLVNKQRNGLQRSWYPNGKLMLEANFREGKLLNGKTWDLSGNLASTVTAGTGALILYDADGKRRRESVYLNGFKQKVP